MKQRENGSVLLPTVGIAALFLLGFLLLVVFGARIYRDAVDSQYNNMDQRALKAYLAASVKANDTLGSVLVKDSEFGQVLVVCDGDTGYALRYYCYEGQLAEDFARVDAPLAPSNAQFIAPTEHFSVEHGADGLLIVTTDAGRTLLGFRSGEEAMP